MLKMPARGIRNHNPGNIRDTGTPWEGIAGSDGEFEIFKNPWWGIRAMAKVLLNYQRKYGLETIGDLVSRWAPSHENPTNEYAVYVADSVGVGKNVKVNLADYETMRAMVESMIEFENGSQPYTWEIDTGLILAGIEPQAEETTA